MEEKVAMAHCHKSQMYEWLPWVGGKIGEVPTKENERIKLLHDQMIVRDGKVAERFREKLMKKYGEKKGKNTVCAEAFEISEYGGQLTEGSISYYFPF